MEDTKKQNPLNQYDQNTYELTVIETISTEPALDEVPELKGEMNT